jgi:hypothetical protein
MIFCIPTDRRFGEAGINAKALSLGVLVHFSTKWKKDYPMNQTLSTAEEDIAGQGVPPGGMSGVDFPRNEFHSIPKPRGQQWFLTWAPPKR